MPVLTQVPTPLHRGPSREQRGSGGPPLLLVEPGQGRDGRAAPPFAPDDRQQQVLAATSRAAVVLGPAGSGKTSVLGRLAADAAAAGVRVLGTGPDPRSVRLLAEVVAARMADTAPGPGRRGAVRISTTHSLALDLVTAEAQASGSAPPRLLTAADAVAVLGDVLAATRDADWPAMFRPAVRTRGFAGRAKDFLARAAMHGWTPRQLSAEAGAGGPEVWAALARVWRRYQRVLDLSGAMDYPDLMTRAVAAAGASSAGWGLVVVDEAVDLDPQQWRLLAALLAHGGRVVLAGDPDQATNSYRGGAGLAMPAAVAQAVPRGPVQLIGLDRSYRCRPQVLAAVQNLQAGLPMPGVPVAAVRGHRTAAPAAGPDRVSVRTYPDARLEAAGIAEEVRRFGLAVDGAPGWDRAAVLVRAVGAIGAIEQALALAGVPFVVEAADRAVPEDPVAARLLRALAWAAHLAGQAAEPDPEQVLDLLRSRLVGADAAALRRAGERLRRDEVLRARQAGRRPASTAELLMRAVGQRSELDGPPALARFAERLSRAVRILQSEGAVGEALWALWSDAPAGPGTWAARLRAEALEAGPDSAGAHRALDAVQALFDEADRTSARGGAVGVLAFLAAADGLRADPAAVRPGRRAVTVTTAHAAKGRQWDFVVVAGAVEGVWPGPGGGQGLLGEELLADPAAEPAGLRHRFIADERRLFAAACSRAARRLLVTAVDAGDRDANGGHPSRFVSDLGTDVVAVVSVPRRTSATGLVASLRRAVAGEAAGDQRRAAAAVLAEVAADPAFPSADPARWWGVVRPTTGVRPIWSPQAPLPMTVTGLAEAAACPRRWFATRMLRAVPSDRGSVGAGLLLHRINEAWVRGELDAALEAAEEVLERSWPLLPFDAPWQSGQRRDEFRAALARLLAWHRANGDRIAFAEEPFELRIDAGAAGTVLLRGKADLGVVATGQGLAILDLKSARSKPSNAEVASHVQLAGYQRAVTAGALGSTRAPAAPAGAGLLLPAIPDRAGSPQPKVVWQPPQVGDEAAAGSTGASRAGFDRLVARVAEQMRDEFFPPLPSAACRTCPVRDWCPAKTAPFAHPAPAVPSADGPGPAAASTGALPAGAPC